MAEVSNSRLQFWRVLNLYLSISESKTKIWRCDWKSLTHEQEVLKCEKMVVTSIVVEIKEKKVQAS